jgi:peptidoglycan-associated lipoprotein
VTAAYSAPVAAPARSTAAPAPDAAALAARERERRAAEANADRLALATVLYFEYDKDELRPEVTRALEQVADVLRRRPSLTIRLNGNADDRGSDEYNLALGQRRAAAAKRWLVDHGIPADRVAIVSFGRERPVCKDDVESCWQKNRRDEVVVTRGDDVLTATGT